VIKKKLEWNKGFTDIFAPNNVSHVCNYLTKYITKNYFSDYNKPLKEDKSNILLTILWLFRKHTISHSRLDKIFDNNLKNDIKQINVTQSPTKRFIGLIIIDYSISLLEFLKKHYKKQEIIKFEINKNQKYIIVKNLKIEYNINLNDLIRLKEYTQSI